MATISKAMMRPYRAGRHVRIRGYQEGATQTFVKGDVLQPDTAAGVNRIKEADADETTILGVAAEKASGTAATELSVWIADAEGEWIGNVSSTTAATDVGTKYGIVKDSAGIWLVDKADAVNTRLKILKILDTVGDTNGRVVFKWLAASVIYGE